MGCMGLSEAAKTALLGSGAHLPQGTPVDIQHELLNAHMVTPYGVLTARGMDMRDEILNERLNKLDAVTPAEARTGVLDREAAIRSELAGLRHWAEGADISPDHYRAQILTTVERIERML